VARLLEVPGLLYEGLYGMGESAPIMPVEAVSHAESAATAVPGAWVEDKGGSVAIHYRQAPDPAAARAALVLALERIAPEMGLEMAEGKMVVELVPAGRPRKGGTVERLVARHRLSGALFAGDDVADLDAFASLDRLASEGFLAVKVAVRGAETPDVLIDSADVVVDGPEGLVGLLRQLV
jgi:trehalose 6-phosphate phosphatase